jgi:hypothetical protein
MLARYGCRTVLRATYLDVTQTFVVTSGIAVLHTTPGDGPALAASPRPPTVRPASFPGAAEDFGDTQYVTGGLAEGDGPYAVLTAAGYADGRAYTPSCPPDERLTKLARDLATSLLRRLTT